MSVKLSIPVKDERIKKFVEDIEYKTPLPLMRPEFFCIFVFEMDAILLQKEGSIQEKTPMELYTSFLQRLGKQLKKIKKICIPEFFAERSPEEAQLLLVLYEENPLVFFNLMVNSFISSVVVDRTRKGESTAHLELRFQNYEYPFFEATWDIFEQVFSPMFPVRIYMKSRFKNELIPVFTGYVTDFTYSDSSGFLSISLGCTDVTKLLEINPINIAPAIVEWRAFGQPLFDKDGRFRGRVVANVFTQMTAENILKTLILGTQGAPQRLINLGISSVDGLGVAREVRKQLLVKEQTENDNKAGAIREKRNIVNYFYRIIPASVFKPELIYGATKIVPYLYLDMAESPIFQSDIVSRMDVIRDLSDRTYHEFFADEVGNFWFVPLRLNPAFLIYDIILDKKKESSFKRIKNVDPRTYILTEDEIISASFTVNDRAMVSAVDVFGEYPFTEGGAGNDIMTWALRGFYTDSKLVRQIGVRWQRVKMPLLNNLNLALSGELVRALEQKQITQLREAGKTKEADELKQKMNRVLAMMRANSSNLQGLLNQLAKVYLQYLNSTAYTSSVSLVLRPEMNVAKPVYFPNRKELFYIDSISHSITVGSEASTKLTLSSGRKEDEIVDFVDLILRIHSPTSVFQMLTIETMKKYLNLTSKEPGKK